MLTRIHHKVTFECDRCTETLDTETSEFEEARAMMQAEGWTSRQIKGQWHHCCPNCGGSKP